MTLTVSAAKLDDYRQVAPRGAVDLLLRIGERLNGRRLVHVSDSRYRGLTIEVLNRLVRSSTILASTRAGRSRSARAISRRSRARSTGRSRARSRS
jgi:hypothetical protein